MEFTKSRLLFSVLLLNVLFILPAKAAFTAANVKGSYGFLLNTWTEPTGSQGASLGIATFDGVSAVTVSFTFVNGTTGLQTGTGSGTYSVNSDGTGSMSLSLSTGITVQVDFVLNSISNSIAKGLQLLVINNSTTDTQVSAGPASLINLSGAATAANLKGRYSVQFNKWTTGTQLASVGVINLDGVSKVTVSFTQQQGPGPVATGTGSGTYSVNSDGSGSTTFTITSGGTTQTVQLDFVLNSVSSSSFIAKGLQLLNAASTSSDTATGTAVHQ